MKGNSKRGHGIWGGGGGMRGNHIFRAWYVRKRYLGGKQYCGDGMGGISIVGTVWEETVLWGRYGRKPYCGDGMGGNSIVGTVWEETVLWGRYGRKQYCRDGM